MDGTHGDSYKTPSQSQPVASIILVVYNGFAYLSGCLSSLREAFESGCEVIVIDNGSTDGGLDFVRQHYPHVVLVENSSNLGFAVACNRGAALAGGDILVFLNQDTQVKPGWLAGLLDGVAIDDRVGLTTSKVLLMSQPDRIQLCGQNLHFTGLAFGRGLYAYADAMTSLAKVTAVSGASFAIQRELWEKLGGFDELFYMYYEETDLSWRAQLAGYECLYVPDSVVYHDFRPARPSYSQLFYAFRNRYLLLLKNWYWITLLLLSPSLILAELIDWCVALAYGRMGLQAKIKANLWLARHIREIWRLHRRTQMGTRVPDWMILGERTHWLEPKVVTGGIIGRAAAACANVVFVVNHQLARLVCRASGV